MRAELKPMFEQYMKQLKENPDWQREFSSHGKGIVEAYLPNDKKTKLLEEFHKVESCNPAIIKEQWTIALPQRRTAELAAHLRDFVYVSDAIKGKVGDVVNIPVVRDLDFANVTAGTGAITATTGLVGTLTTTLYEAGASYDAYYTDIEQIDSNLLDELNSVMAHAAIRSEDARLLNLLCNGTTSAWGETVLGSNPTQLYAGEPYFASASTFAVSWIADAIGIMIKKGKDVRPGEMILSLTAAMYVTLLKKLSATTNTAVAYAKPSIWTQGMVESYLGVRILVSGYESRTTSGTGIGGGGTSYQVGFLMRPRRCLALAPKRDILIETDKQILARTLRIVATHTFGAAILDQTEAVKINSGVTATATTGLGVD